MLGFINDCRLLRYDANIGALELRNAFSHPRWIQISFPKARVSLIMGFESEIAR